MQRQPAFLPAPYDLSAASSGSAKAAAGPVVERVASWSTRHRKTAIFGWLLLVACAVVLGQLLGTKNLRSYDPGQAGRAERVLNQPGVVQRPSEGVLIQAGSVSATLANDAQLRRATEAVVTTLASSPGVARDVRSPLGPGGRSLVSADGRSALVTFTVAGDPSNADKTVLAAEHAVAAVKAKYPGLRIAEAGPASLGAATNSVVGQDFRRAEVTSVPITLVLLCGRHRLLAVLPAQGAGGTGQGPQSRPGGPAGGRHFRARDRGVRADGDDLAGRAVPDRH